MILAALHDGAIAGAFRDSTHPEPLPAEHPLWSAINCVISMHLSGRGQTSMVPRGAALFRRNLDAFLAARTMETVVDLDAEYRSVRLAGGAHRVHGKRMDLGLSGRTAIVCASSHGLGRACATELARAGVRIVVNGREPDALAATAQAIRDETGATVSHVAGDVANAAVQQALVEAADALGGVDILVNNNGGPPLRDFRTLDAAAIHAGIDANMVTPIAMVQRVIDGMVTRGFGRIVCITSASVKAPVGGLDLSSGARIGLTGFLAGVARQVAHAGVTINFLLPGLFATRRLEGVHEFAAKSQSISTEEADVNSRARIPAGRFGEPAEFGAACAFLCSAQAGYITGQSLLMDGGAYPGVL